MAEKKTAERPKTAKLFIPAKDRNDKSRFLGLNGKRYQVRTNEEVEVPYGLKLVYEESVRGQERVDAYIEAHKSKSKKEDN